MGHYGHIMTDNLSTLSVKEIYSRHHGSDDDVWTELIIKSAADPENCNHLPGYPSIQVQKAKNGEPATDSMVRAAPFYRLVKKTERSACDNGVRRL
jgi:hypothetical protein